jgi:hypothetical protein
MASNPAVAANSKVHIVGYPLGTYLEPTPLPFSAGDPPRFELGRRLTPELLKALRERSSPDPAISVLFLVGPLHPGHSGAPVLDSSNRVLAVANGSIRFSAGYGWAVSLQGIAWSPVQSNRNFQALKTRAPSIALFSFDANAQVAQERITLTLEAIKEDTARLLKLQTLAASKDRLQILRDFVPRIGDSSVRFSERSIALAECINSGVFQNTAAFEKAAEFVNQAYSLEEQRIGFPQLVEALAPLAPKHLDFIAHESAFASGGRMFTPVRSPNVPAERSRASTFWWSVFQRALADYPEIMLAALSETQFAAQRYADFDKLFANVPEAAVVRMENYPSRSIRGLAAIQRVSRSREPHKPALRSIVELIAADNDDELHLAGALLDLARRHAALDAALAETSLTIVKNDGPTVSASLGQFLGETYHGRGREARIRAAEKYVVWSAQLEAVSIALEPVLLKDVGAYDVVLHSFELKKPDRGNGDLYARASIRALISLNKGCTVGGRRSTKGYLLAFLTP